MTTVPTVDATQTLQQPSLTHLLHDWRVPDVEDFTDEIEILHPEEMIIGGFSEVFKGLYTVNKHTGTTEVVAVKKLNVINFRSRSNSEITLRLCKRLAREVRVWTPLNHPNVIHLKGVYMSNPDRRPGMVMPWYRHGNTYDYLGTRFFTVSEKFTLFLEIACGLEYLHKCSPPVIHGDLKAGNVLIDDDGHAVLCDFGISRIFEEVLESTGSTTSGAVAGSLRWSAPEVISNEELTRFTPESDVWSFGCTGYEIFTGQFPYYENRTSGPIAKRILEGGTPTWPGSVTPNGSTTSTQRGNGISNENGPIPDDVISFINLRWRYEAGERGEMGEILNEMRLLLPLLL